MNLFNYVKQPRFVTGFIFIFNVLLWMPTLKFGYVWDDMSTIVGNTSLLQWSTLGRAFTNDFWALHDISQLSGYYRPLVTVAYVLTAKVFGLHAWAFHLVNILTHALCCALFFNVLLSVRKRFFPQESDQSISGIFLMSLMVSCHPLIVEPVAFISALPDLMMMFFALLSVFAWFSRSSIFYTVVFLGCSMLCKESAISFVLILGTSMVFMQGQKRRHGLIALGTMLSVYLLVRWWAIPSFQRSTLFIPYDVRFSLVSKVSAYAVRFLAFPYPLTPIHPLQLPAGWTSPWFWATIVLFVLIAVCFFLRKYIPRKVFWGLATVLVLWLPYSQIFPIEGLFADRYMYPILFALAGTFALCFKKVPKVVWTVPLIYTTMAVSYAQVWAQNETLWNQALVAAPDSPVVFNELGNLDMEKKDYTGALGFYEKALVARPFYREASLNRVVSLYKLEQLENAKNAIQSHLSLFKEDPQAYDIAASIYVSLRDWKQALAHQQKAIQLNPQNWKLMYNYALLLFQQGQWEESKKIYEKLLKFPQTQVEANAQLQKIKMIQQL